MLPSEFLATKNGDKVKYCNKRYYVSYLTPECQERSLGCLKSKGGYIVNIDPNNVTKVEKGWKI